MLAGLIVLAGSALRVPGARADQTVVSAAIYSGSAGSAQSVSVSLSALDGCPTYAGSSPIYLYPAAQPYQPATDSSWALSTVLTCGLQVPLADAHSVQIDSPNRGFELPLSAADLSQPSPFQDPNAYPVISNDGGEDQNTYTRPWRGGSDQNAADQVTNNGPIAIVVYENGAPLTVAPAQRVVSKTSTAEQVQLSATVTQPDGTPVSASALTWSWSFADDSTSTEATPTRPFPSGSSIVTVQVTDTAAGTGGTATLDVVYQPSPTTTGTPRPGAGTHRNGAPAGPKTGTGNQEGGHQQSGTGGVPAPQTKSTQPRTEKQTQSGSQTTAQTTAPTQTQTATVPATTTPAPATPARRRHGTARRRRRTAPRTSTPAGQLVSGRLVSDVRPVAPGTSPLVHLEAATAGSAAAVRSARSPTTVNAVYGGLAVVLLLWLGGRRERRGRRRARRSLNLHR